MKNITFVEAVLQATDQMLEKDKNVILFGLGVTDPKGIFGTTKDLHKKYGTQRVFDMPISENAMTGVCIGAAITGLRPIMTHQRADFAFLALDQLINNAAKWFYMFAEQMSVPIVIRLIIGQGWGQGPQHSQSLHGILSHIPGLKIVMPSNPYDAKGLLISSIKDNNPVIYLEHRWLHNMIGAVPEDVYEIPIGKGAILEKGKDLTIISFSNMTCLARQAIDALKKYDISSELIDLRSVKPFDIDLILSSVKKTKKVMILDPDWKTCGISAEISTLICENLFNELDKPPLRISYPDRFVPTIWTLANHFYPISYDIVLHAMQLLDKNKNDIKKIKEEIEKNKTEKPLDVPDETFKGPF